MGSVISEEMSIVVDCRDTRVRSRGEARRQDGSEKVRISLYEYFLELEKTLLAGGIVKG